MGGLGDDKGVQQIEKSLFRLGNESSNTSEKIREITKKTEEFKAKLKKEMGGKGFDLFDIGSLGMGVKDLELAEKHLTKFKEAAMSAGPLIAIAGTREGIKKLGDATHLNELQERLMTVEKHALQAGLAFGQTFKEAAGSVDGFQKGLRRINILSKSFPIRLK